MLNPPGFFGRAAEFARNELNPFLVRAGSLIEEIGNMPGYQRQFGRLAGMSNDELREILSVMNQGLGGESVVDEKCCRVVV